MNRPHRNLRLAFIASGGGSVMDALCRVQHEDWHFQVAGIVTDRRCKAELVAHTHDVPLCALEGRDMNFSSQSAAALRSWNAECVVLLMLRRIGVEVWRDLRVPVLNLHPSLLPAYPGLGALRRNYHEALRAARVGAKICMGVTIHVATDELDAGPIIAQRAFTLDDAPTLRHAEHWCYLYKVALLLDTVYRLAAGSFTMASGSNRMGSEPAGCVAPEALMDVILRFGEPWVADRLRSCMGDPVA